MIFTMTGLSFIIRFFWNLGDHVRTEHSGYCQVIRTRKIWFSREKIRCDIKRPFVLVLAWLWTVHHLWNKGIINSYLAPIAFVMWVIHLSVQFLGLFWNQQNLDGCGGAVGGTHGRTFINWRSQEEKEAKQNWTALKY